jgi:hypothetical protein
MYPDSGVQHTEPVMAWYEAIDHFGATDKDLHERTFRAAVIANAVARIVV